MKRVAVALAGVALLVCIGVPGEVWAQGKKATVKVVNKSDWQIDQFFLSSSDDEEWGPDQLGEDVIGTDETFELRNIPCDTYDVMLVDEDGDECVVEAVDICGGKESWVITNKILLGCQEASE
jgi:hypothetical protein